VHAYRKQLFARLLDVLGVWSLLTSEGSSLVDETSVVEDSLLSATDWGAVLLLLRLDLWGLSSDFTGTSQTSVYLSYKMEGKKGQ